MLQLLIFFASMSSALEIPQQLTPDDQRRVLEIVGLGTTGKFLSEAHSLGGFSGLELSLSVESINTREISTLGNQVSTTQQFFYPNLTIGKGIFNNSDIFIYFIPPINNSDLSKYGASFRWSFYEALFLPINFSVITHINSSNIKNQVILRNLGADLLAGMTLNNFSFSFGLGWANSAGNFTGGTNGVTLSQQLEGRKVESSHFTIGGTYKIDAFFFGISLDRYKEEVVTFKAGLRF